MTIKATDFEMNIAGLNVLLTAAGLQERAALILPTAPTPPAIVTKPPAPVIDAPKPATDTTKPATGPITITKGGVYTGLNVQYDRHDAPLIDVLTDQPVTLVNPITAGPGTHIRASWKWVNLTVKGGRGHGIMPTAPGMFAGRYLHVEGFTSLNVEGVRFDGTSGMYVNGWSGKLGNPYTLRIFGNTGRNIDGRKTDARGQMTGDFYRVQFLQINNLKAMPGVDIAWNDTRNDPRLGHQEDLYSVFACTGVRSSWIRLHHNRMRGSYTDVLNADHSGSGIMLADGGGEYIEACDNTILETGNAGIGVADGNNIAVRRNTILSTGLYPDGTPTDAKPDFGIYARDYDLTTVRDPSTVIVEENTVGMGRPTKSNPNARYDISVAKDGAGKPLASSRNNILIPPGPISAALLDAAGKAWADAWATVTA